MAELVKMKEITLDDRPLILPTLIEIWEEASCNQEETLTYDHMQIIRSCTHLYLSDSGDSYCSFFLMSEGKYHMHVGTKRKRAMKSLGPLMIGSMRDVLYEKGADVLIGWTDHRGLQMLYSKGSGGKVSTVSLPNKEKMYIVTKDNFEEIEKLWV